MRKSYLVLLPFLCGLQIVSASGAAAAADNSQDPMAAMQDFVTSSIARDNGASADDEIPSAKPLASRPEKPHVQKAQQDPMLAMQKFVENANAQDNGIPQSKKLVPAPPAPAVKPRVSSLSSSASEAPPSAAPLAAPAVPVVSVASVPMQQNPPQPPVASAPVAPALVTPAPAAPATLPPPLPPVQTRRQLPVSSAQNFVEGQDIPGQWWMLFHAETLNALIDEALSANPDAAAAQAALRQAQEEAYADEGGLFPTIGGTGSFGREKQSKSALLPGINNIPNVSASPYNVSTASLNVSYAPDVFGGVHHQIESSKAAADYEQFQLEATYLTLTSNVVNAAITVASLNDQIGATENIIASEDGQLTMVKQQYSLGAVARADVLAQAANLAQIRATLPPLQKQLAWARNQLMTYLGRFPSQDKGENFNLAAFSLPEELPVSLPSKIVEQRPDVRAAEAQLKQAAANVGVAISNQMPLFNITSQMGGLSHSLSKLFASGNGLWSIAGSITQPIFDAGTLKHRRRAAEAAYKRAAAQYRKTVLYAFQDVANALCALQADADALNAQAIAERLALDSLNITQEQYKVGAISQIARLNAEQTYQNAVINRVRAQAARYSDTVALFQALGGGWWNRSDVPPQSKDDHTGMPVVEAVSQWHSKNESTNNDE